MKKSLKWAILTGLMGLYQLLPAQDLIYDAFFRGNKIGYMEVTQEMRDQQMIAKSVTVLEVTLLFKIKIDIRYESVFVAGNLTRSVAETYRDGELASRTNGYRAGNAYKMERDGEEWSVNAPQIRHSVNNMYWVDPRLMREVYSERWGTFLKVEKQEDNRIALTLPSGDVNYYQYQNNIATFIEVNHGWVSVDFKLRT